MNLVGIDSTLIIVLGTAFEPDIKRLTKSLQEDFHEFSFVNQQSGDGACSCDWMAMVGIRGFLCSVIGWKDGSETYEECLIRQPWGMPSVAVLYLADQSERWELAMTKTMGDDSELEPVKLVIPHAISSQVAHRSKLCHSETSVAPNALAVKIHLADPS